MWECSSASFNFGLLPALCILFVFHGFFGTTRKKKKSCCVSLLHTTAVLWRTFRPEILLLTQVDPPELCREGWCSTISVYFYDGCFRK